MELALGMGGVVNERNTEVPTLSLNTISSCHSTPEHLSDFGSMPLSTPTHFNATSCSSIHLCRRLLQFTFNNLEGFCDFPKERWRFGTHLLLSLPFLTSSGRFRAVVLPSRVGHRTSRFLEVPPLNPWHLFVLEFSATPPPC
jgi:hypothetical protein